MKIAQIMASGGDGGLEKHFIDLCNGLAEKGHSVYAVCSAKYKGRLSSKVNFIGVDLTGSRKNPITIFKLFAVLNRIRPEITHAQANKAAQMLAPCLRLLNTKSVVTIHNQKSNLSFLKKFDLCVGVSKGVIDNFPKDTKKLVIYNGVSLPPDSPHDASIPKSLTNTQKSILSVGRLVPAKGFDMLIEAAEHVDAKFMIAGDGPERAALEALITSKQLDDRVMLLGHRNDISGLIKEADLIAISSRKEGYSYVFAESLLLKKPIVSTDVPIPNEVLPKKYISKIDSNDLSIKLQAALNSLGELNEFQNLFEYAVKNLTFVRQLEKTIQAYRKILV